MDNIKYTFNENGIPCCPPDSSLPMKREGSKSYLRSKLSTIKFVSPKMKWEYNWQDKSKLIFISDIFWQNIANIKGVFLIMIRSTFHCCFFLLIIPSLCSFHTDIIYIQKGQNILIDKWPFLCYLYFLIHPRKTLHTNKTAEIIASILIICRSLSFISWFLYTLGNHINTTVISHDTLTIILNIISLTLLWFYPIKSR